MTRVAVGVILLLFFGCASDAGNGSEEKTSGSFDEDLAALCSETTSAKDSAVSGQGLGEDLDSVLAAHQDLESALAELEPPPERADAFDAYLAELGVYVDAMERGYDEEEEDAEALGALVDNARSAVELEELADPARIPEDCPPGADVSVHNTLFVTEANLGCYELSEDLLVAGPIQTPKTAKGIGIVVDLGKSVSAGIAGVIRRADSPDGDDRIPVDELIQANKKRFLAVEALANTFRSADFAAYKQAAKRLKTISRRADRLASSVGLVHCAEVFNLLPFWR